MHAIMHVPTTVVLTVKKEAASLQAMKACKLYLHEVHKINVK
jgi:hypothetical protein